MKNESKWRTTNFKRLKFIQKAYQIEFQNSCGVDSLQLDKQTNPGFYQMNRRLDLIDFCESGARRQMEEKQWKAISKLCKLWSKKP